MSKNKNSYEISLWHEVVGGIEEKIAILGSSESEFEGRARNCKFKVNMEYTSLNTCLILLYLLHTASENTNIRLKHVFSGIEANKT
jgi:hypothetical protein